MRLIEKFLSLFYLLLNCCKKNINLKGVFFLCKIKAPKLNSLKLRGRFRFIKLTIDGENNSIEINGYLSHVKITIIGNNNKVSINGAIVTDSEIIIRGNGGLMAIGKKTDVISAYIVCQGENNSIEIGDDCLFSTNIDIWNSDTHPIYDENGRLVNPSKPIIIGNHVWIGKHVKILKGSTIGDGSVLGMGAVVSGTIPPHSVAVGSPCRVVRNDCNWENKLIKK